MQSFLKAKHENIVKKVKENKCKQIDLDKMRALAAPLTIYAKCHKNDASFMAAWRFWVWWNTYEARNYEPRSAFCCLYGMFSLINGMQWIIVKRVGKFILQRNVDSWQIRIFERVKGIFHAFSGF